MEHYLLKICITNKRHSQPVPSSRRTHSSHYRRHCWLYWRRSITHSIATELWFERQCAHFFLMHIHCRSSCVIAEKGQSSLPSFSCFFSNMLARPLNTIPRTVNAIPKGKWFEPPSIIDEIMKHAPEMAKQIDANLKLLIFLFPIIFRFFVS